MNGMKKLALMLTLGALAACNGGGGGGGYSGGGTVGGGTVGGGTTGGGSSSQSFTSPSATVNQFVDSLNHVDPSSDSYVELYEDETFRAIDEGLDDWFVIWDDKYDEYKAVSLQYVRSIVYIDYVRNTDALASEFRAIENDDIDDDLLNGDKYGDDYEVVDYDSGTDSFWGRNSGYEYEDEAESMDVNLMAAKEAEMKFFKKAAAVSYEFNISLSSAMGMLSLGEKAKMMGQDGISTEDFAVLTTDLQKATGVSMSDLATKSIEENVAQMAETTGSTPAAVEQKLLPGLFNINL